MGRKILKIIKNKYLITIIGFGIWLLIFDQHNLVDRIKTRRYLNKMVQDTSHYHHEIIKDKEIINQLETDRDNLEKFARENYLMKKADEDIFIIVKEEE